jgi:hypothetical protein
MQCARHPDTETHLRCGRCEKPICPQCTVFGPAGARCRDCAALHSSPLYHVSATSLAKAIAAGLFVAVLGGVLLATLRGFGFFLLFVGFLYGQGVASVIQCVAGRKLGVAMEVAAGVCTVSGAIVGFLLWYATQNFSPGFPPPVPLLIHHPLYLLAVAISILGAISRIRFL